MTTVTTTSTDGIDFYWDLSQVQTATVTSFGPTQVVLTISSDEGDATLTLNGTFTAFDGQNRPTSGTITQLIIQSDGVTTITVPGGLAVSAWNAFIAAHDTIGLTAALFAAADTLTGGAGDDTLMGLAGNDSVDGGAGHDYLRGGDGDDIVNGGTGDDTVHGSAGNDIVNGGDGNDMVVGGLGTDTINGGNGNDFIVSGPGIGSNANIGLPVASFSAQAFYADPSPDVIDGGAGGDTLFLFLGEASGDFQVDISNPAVVSTVLRNGVAFGSITGIETGLLTGGMGNDTLIGGAGNDSLGGSVGNDTLVGNNGSDTINGDAGDDTLTGGAGNDNINGGVGIDTAVFSGIRSAYTFTFNSANGIGTLSGPDGNDTISNVEFFQFSDGTLPLVSTIFTGDAGPNSLTGQAGALNILRGLGGIDTLTGADGIDMIDGGDGDDTLSAAGGNDQIAGGLGNDTIDGGLGQDLINGGDGNDTINGGAYGSQSNGDTIFGDDGNDQITGDGALLGGTGDDVLTDTPDGVATLLYGGLGSDTLNGAGAETTASYATSLAAVTINLALAGPQNTIGAGVDTLSAVWNISGSNYDDILTGDGHANLISGGPGDDNIAGAGGDDTLLGGYGDDVMDGGAGIDTVSYNGLLFDVEVDLRIVGPQFTGRGGGFDTFISIENLIGSAQNDYLTGTDGANNLSGLGGSDTLIGLGGDDVMDGGFGPDMYFGGLGNDTFNLDMGNDWEFVFENPGEGTDTIIVSTSFYLYANVENLTLTTTMPSSYGVGNELNNIINGDAGDNLLISWDGTDTINGGAGNDNMFGVNGDDILNGQAGIDYLVAGDGNDTVDGGADPDALYGEDGNDTLIGGTGFYTDIFVGGAGADTLRGDSGLGDYDLMDGGAGDDTYYVDTPDDLTFEAVGGGVDTVIANISGAGYYLWANTDNLTLQGATPFGVGNELNNVLTGSAAVNWLLGGAGNDTLNGKAGNDVLFGQAGTDTFVFERGTGGDVIGDFQVGVDKIELDDIYANFAELLTHMVDNGGTTAIDLGAGDFIIVGGVAKAAFTAADFVFKAAGQATITGWAYEDEGKAGFAGAEMIAAPEPLIGVVGDETVLDLLGVGEPVRIGLHY